MKVWMVHVFDFRTSDETLKTRIAQAWGWHPKLITDRCKVRRLRHPHAVANASPRPGAEGLERVERTEGLECQGRPGAADPVGAGERTAGGSSRRRKRLEAWTMWRGWARASDQVSR